MRDTVGGMQRLIRLFWKPWLPLVLLMGAAALTVLRAGTPLPLDDFNLYQSFVEMLARGRIDLTIAGFHGSDFFAVPWYLISGSPIAQIQTLFLWIILLPLLAYFAGRSVCHSGSVRHGRDNVAALLFACIIAMMPFISYVAWRGWTGPAYWGLMLLSIALARRMPLLAGIALAFAILTKPFAIVLLPLLFVLAPQRLSSKAATVLRPYAGRRMPSMLSAVRPYWGIIATIAIPFLYALAQYAMAGRVFVGAHDTALSSLWIGVERLALNLAHGAQILFSVHNYYFPDPALTGPGNLLHTSPVLMFLGVFALLLPSLYFEDRKVYGALLLGAVIGLVLPAFMDHMDHFYMEAGVLLLILAALPTLRRHPLWVPIVLATLHFQWLYFYLQFREPFALTHLFFLMPAVVDTLFLVWCCSWIPLWFNRLRQWWATFRFRHWIIGPARSTRVQFFRYFWVGGFSTIVDFCVFFFCVHFLDVHYLLAQFFAYCAGFVVNYMLSILWVFQKTKHVVREIATVFVLTMVGLLFTELLLLFFVEKVGWGEGAAKVVTTILVLFWNFGARRFVVYRNPSKA